MNARTSHSQPRWVEGEPGQLAQRHSASVGWAQFRHLFKMCLCFPLAFLGQNNRIRTVQGRVSRFMAYIPFHGSINVLLCSLSANSIKNPTLSLRSYPSAIRLQFSTHTEHPLLYEMEIQWGLRDCLWICRGNEKKRLWKMPQARYPPSS